MLSLQWSEIPKLAVRLLGKKDHSNKRSVPRARTRNLVKSQPTDYSSSQHLSNLVDISAAGLRFVARTKLKTGTHLQLVINLAEKNIQVPLVGQVVWTRSIEGHASGYYVGISIVQINEEDRRHLQEIVENYRKLRRRKSPR